SAEYGFRGLPTTNKVQPDRAPPREDHASLDDQVSAKLKRAYQKIRQFMGERSRNEKYAFINIKNGKKFKTYVVNMHEGTVADVFDSLIGYRGIGCGKGQTRPGIFRLHNRRGIGASRKPHWGNNWKYYVMQNIGGHSRRWGGRGCGIYYQHVAHSNRHMKGASAQEPARGRYSAGCFVTSPEKFNQWTSRVAGNALIYNYAE
ncbi:MAG: hypothetical protein AAF203_02795, partial [Pseudomonadota bacterium]